MYSHQFKCVNILGSNSGDTYCYFHLEGTTPFLDGVKTTSLTISYAKGALSPFVVGQIYTMTLGQL